MPYTPRGVIYFQTRLRGGLTETGGLIWEAGGLFNLAKMVVSVLHKELECKVDKLRYKKLEVTGEQKQIRISKTWINHPGSVQMKFYSGDWLIQSIIY